MCGRNTVFVLAASIAVVIMAVVLNPIDESQPYAEIWQLKSVTETNGPTAWNGTMAMFCAAHADCGLVKFVDGRDYVINKSFSRRLLWFSHYSVHLLYNLIHYDNPRRMMNKSEMCMYGGCYGVQNYIDTSVCPPETQMSWRMFKGCRTPAEHEADYMLFSRIFDDADTTAYDG